MDMQMMIRSYFKPVDKETLIEARRRELTSFYYQNWEESYESMQQCTPEQLYSNIQDTNRRVEEGELSENYYLSEEEAQERIIRFSALKSMSKEEYKAYLDKEFADELQRYIGLLSDEEFFKNEVFSYRGNLRDIAKNSIPKKKAC